MAAAFTCLPSGGPTVTNSWQMPADFNDQGWLFEAVPDTRTNGAPGGDTNELAELNFSGDLLLVNGDLTNDGPTYTSDEFYPYVQLDTNHDWLILHPGPNIGASLGYGVCRSGAFQLTGAFARANDFQYAGEGVAVAIIRNLDTTNMLFTTNIPSSAPVNTNNLFQGPGAFPFNVTANLDKGDILRFVVFTATNGDNGFDATGLTFTATEPPASRFVINASRQGTNLLLNWAALADETYEVQSSTNLLNWQPVAQLTSTATNQLYFTMPLPARGYEAFRVQLVP